MSESRDAINAAASSIRPVVPMLRLNPRMDPDILAPVFARHGRIHVPAIFDRATALTLNSRAVLRIATNRTSRGSLTFFLYPD